MEGDEAVVDIDGSIKCRRLRCFDEIQKDALKILEFTKDRNVAKLVKKICGSGDKLMELEEEAHQRLEQVKLERDTADYKCRSLQTTLAAKIAIPAAAAPVIPK